MSAPSPGARRLSSAVASASGSSSASSSGSSSDAMAGDPVGSQATQTPTPTPTSSANISTNISTNSSTNSSTSSSSNSTSAAANATDDGFASSYGDESASGASDANLMYRRTQGTCAYYPVDSSGCRAPRSCFDCLNYDVAPERAGCMVSERGQCVTMTGNYSLARDFHFAAAANANATNSTNGSTAGSGSGSYFGANVTVLSATGYEFAAANATYCATNDTKCAACRRGVFLDYDTASITTTSLFCTGADGCVCIALCELDAWATRVGGSQCQSTTTITVSGVGGSSSGNTTAINSGAGGAGSDDSTYGGVRGVDANSGDSIKLGAFWNAAFGVIGVLALALVVVIFLSKQHQRTRQQQDRTGTPQAPVISPRADPRPPESLIEFLVRRPRRDQHQSSAGRRTIGGATTRTSRATVDGDEGEDGGLRLAGWKAMRQELIEKETLRPEIGASGIQRVAISHCLPVGCNPDSTDTLAADCVSPRVQRRNPFNEVDDDAILGSRMQRFTARSLSSSAYMSPPSDAIAFMDEIDEVFDGERGHDNDALDCFDELTTPPARIQSVSGTKL